jgi:hypothetical protein
MTRPDAAVAIVVGTAAVALAGDACLSRRQQRLVTDVLRTKAGMAFQLYLLAHVVDVLGPFDLFRVAARHLQP